MPYTPPLREEKDVYQKGTFLIHESGLTLIRILGNSSNSTSSLSLLRTTIPVNVRDKIVRRENGSFLIQAELALIQVICVGVASLTPNCLQMAGGLQFRSEGQTRRGFEGASTSSGPSSLCNAECRSSADLP